MNEINSTFAFIDNLSMILTSFSGGQVESKVINKGFSFQTQRCTRQILFMNVIFKSLYQPTINSDYKVWNKIYSSVYFSLFTQLKVQT